MRTNIDEQEAAVVASLLMDLSDFFREEAEKHHDQENIWDARAHDGYDEQG